MKITSVNNDLVKETAKLQQRKYRDDSGLFLLEGDKCIEEALTFGIEIEKLFILEGYKKFLDVKNTELIETTEAVLSKISSTAAAPKTVGIAKQPKQLWKNDFKNILLLEGIKDAGNLGTIVRTSAAFGIDAIILYGDTVDLYNPKCVRSSVGNLWKVPVFEIKDFDVLKNRCNEYTPVGTLPKAENTVWLNDFIPSEKNLIMFGTESKKKKKKLKNYAQTNITIEMSKNVESLNLSMSVGIILYNFFIKQLF